jgi:hypothetical protein
MSEDLTGHLSEPERKGTTPIAEAILAELRALRTETAAVSETLKPLGERMTGLENRQSALEMEVRKGFLMFGKRLARSQAEIIERYFSVEERVTSLEDEARRQA